MNDSPQTQYPSDLTSAAHPSLATGTLESVTDQLVDSVKHYAREKPTTAILWAAGIGFVLGWKLKPW